MKFNVTQPCAHCPFRKDVRGYLRAERVEQLADQLQNDDRSWFACHETTTSRGRGVKHKQAAQCAGSMLLLDKVGRPNISMRLAQAVGLLDLAKLKLRGVVFDTFKQFVAHHAKTDQRRK